ncbi:MAG TPA: helix-turn-helix domain-containing protein, partial [Candidatus Limnocylindrales bacterium]|nr:helix-turn-helix domain-containing protein [Candidatus Limnocylindrales bacterium]
EAGLDPSRLAAAVWPADTAERLGRRIVHGLVGTVDDEALVVGPDEESLAALARELGVPCGIGRVVPLADLARSLAEAEAAFAIGRERGRVATWRELATLGALVDHQPAERLAPFVEQLIVPLVEHDARRPAELLPTLEAFLAADGAIEPTARRLHIHPNSLRYRLRRIAVLTGRDPRRFLDRAAFQVGLQAWASAHRRNLQQRAGNVVRADD